MSTNEKSKIEVSKELLVESRNKIAGALNLPKLEVVKNGSLGMLVGTSGAITYFGTLDQTKWRMSMNPKKVFDKYEALCAVDGAGEKEKKAFQTFFQSATAPVKRLQHQVVVVEAEQPKNEQAAETPAAP